MSTNDQGICPIFTGICPIFTLYRYLPVRYFKKIWMQPCQLKVVVGKSYIFVFLSTSCLKKTQPALLKWKI